MNVSKLKKESKNKLCLKPKKYSWTLILIPIIILLFTSINLSSKEMKIYFLDVGQGDCIVVKDHDYTFIIDGGGDRFMSDDNNIGKRVVFPFLLDQGIDKLDCVFITHVHYDHIKGVLEVIELLEVETVVLPQVYEEYYTNSMANEALTMTSATIDGKEESIYDEDFVSALFKDGDELFLLEELIELTEENNIEIKFMDEGEIVLGEKSKFTCIYPNVGKIYSEHENENSLVLLLELGGVTTLLTGDIEEEGEKWMISNKPGLKNINILKVSHHGSNSSSSDEFLLKLNPEIGIVSVGENLFGHPSDIVKMRYKNLNIPFYSTKKYGMIEVEIKENYYKVEPYKGELINESIKRTIKE